MPQKKNPDALELIRGKCGRVQGGVNRHDDDAERFAAGLQQRYAGRQRRSVRRARYLAGLLHMAALVLDGIQVKRPRCQEAAQQGYANATGTGGLPGGERRTFPRGAPYRG